jgi:CelD/BcsL family acetyltransferase involved in cellulose biosynthesis
MTLLPIASSKPASDDAERAGAGGPTPAAPVPAAPVFTAVVTLAGDDPRYARFAAQHPYASIFTSPPWIAALEAAYGFRVEIAACLEADRIEAAMPFCRLDDLRGSRLAALPFSDYGDPLVEDPGLFAALVDHVAGLDRGLRLRSLRNPLPAADPRLAVAGESLWHGVDLARPLDDIWAGLKGSARQNIRKAMGSGVTVRIGRGGDDLRRFHRMHAQLRKTKYRMLAQPFVLFEAVDAAFAGAGDVAVVLAEADGEPIAGIFLICWQGTAYYKFNASIDTRLRPNDLLAWEAIRLATEQGCQTFDFGISDANQPGLVRYKSKFATEERQIRQLVLPQQPPAAHEAVAGQALGRLTELLTRPEVPDSVTRAAGDVLYRYFA